jgi:non-specific serine/threonine protein kinase
VLDNCEHLVQACSELAQTLLTSCPNLRILATSRQSLGVGGETRFRVPSLSVPARTVSVEECTDFEAVRLFVDRAVSREPAFALQPDNAGAIVEVCRRLDGIPLAIELAAARIDTLSPEQIAGRLDDALRLLTAGGRTAPPRQQTLRATLDWGYGLLDEREQRLLTRLSVFQGGWSLEAAEAVGSGEDEEAPDICSVLACLIDKSMVVGEPTSRGFARYRMLEPVRQYAWERLHRGQEADRVRRQHASLFLALAEQADCQLRGPEQAFWLERLEQEHDNLRTALSWALDADPELGLRLAGALWWFWAIGGHVGEGRRFLERGLSLGTQAPTRARALLAAGMLAGHQGDHDLSTARFEESLILNREVGDKRATAFALASLGGIAMERGDRPGGRALCDESLSLFREAGDRWGVAIALGFHLGEALLDRDSARIRSLHEEILALFREVGDGWSVAQTLTLGGRLLLELGEPEQAQEPPVDGLRTLWRMGTRYGLWESLDVLAAIAGARGEPSRAARLRGAAETEREAMGITLSSFDRSLYDRYLMEARAQLGPAAFDAALDEGRAMTLEQAVEYALRV